jgi:hypothetical protein
MHGTTIKINTYTEYLILNAFPRLHWLRQRVGMLPRAYSACTVKFTCFNKLETLKPVQFNNITSTWSWGSVMKAAVAVLPDGRSGVRI